MKIKLFYHPTLICIKPPVLPIPDLLCFENNLESIKNRDLSFHLFFFCNITQNFSLLKTQQSELQNKHAEWSFLSVCTWNSCLQSIK